MKNKNIRKKIESAYNIPEPIGKDEFFRENDTHYKVKRGKIILRYGSMASALAVVTGISVFAGSSYFGTNKKSDSDTVSRMKMGTVMESAESESGADNGADGAEYSADSKGMFSAGKIAVDSIGDGDISEEVVRFDEAFMDSESRDEEPVYNGDVSADEPAEEYEEVADEYDYEEFIMPYESDETAKAFVLTAGEWNDNKNWGFFTNIVNSQLISFPSYGLNPLNRIAVTVENDGEPVKKRKVELCSGEEIIWTSYTDRDGKAYLFFNENTGDFTVRTDGAEPVSVVPDDSDSEETVETDVQGQNIVHKEELSLETSEKSAESEKTEVMFIIDSTGSMGDEIMYLQKDFASIAEEVADENMTFSVNFYRDTYDDYVTKCNPFTSDVNEVQQILNNESAEGGGDMPEAVAEILTETITDGTWSEDSDKIAFLIFDAPPHADREAEIQEAIKSASLKGIHIVPVVASDSDRDTEVFGRAVSIMTNSNYVFLTDDSGVGNSHSEPIIGSYNVELLHDIIVRNIKEISE